MTEIETDSTTPVMLPLEADALPERWAPVDPASAGLDVETLFVTDGIGAGYRPNITVARYVAGVAAVEIADSTLADTSEATLLTRDEAEASCSQLVEFWFQVGDRRLVLRLAEVVMTWHSLDPAYLDTNVVARMMCTIDQFDDSIAEFAAFVGSMTPDVSA